MSLIISNIALHFISKKEESGDVLLRLGPENIEVSSKITAFVDGLHTIYNAKGSKAYGSFSVMPAAGSNEDGETSAARFVDLMESYLAERQSFYQFSTQAANTLKNEIEKYDLEESGYLVVCHYEYMGGRYLLATIIPVSEHYSVDGELIFQRINISIRHVCNSLLVLIYLTIKKTNKWLLFFNVIVNLSFSD